MATVSIRKRTTRPGERGQILPIFALLLVVLCGFAALAVDVGYWRYQQRLEQSAADSAAIAAAAEVAYTTSTSNATDKANVQTAGTNDATTNGYTSGTANTTVTVNWPPATGPNAGNGQSVEVTVARVMPAFFLGAIMPSGFAQTVQARAVAKRLDTGGGCIYVMKGSISGDLTLHGGGRGGITTVPLCGVIVNGNMTVTGQANIDASFISYVGNGPGGGSYPHAQPQKGLPTSDPCARIAGCAYLATLSTTNPGLFSAPCQDVGGVLPPNPLPPGHYCGTATHVPYSQSPIILAGGLYIMDNGMFRSLIVSTVTGSGATIYNNCTSTVCADTTLSGGNVQNTIVAPTSGPSAGVAYYQPPSLVNAITVNGAAGTITDMGGVYAPNGTFTFNGQLPSIAFLVAGDIIMNGGGLAAGSSLYNNTSALNAVLVE